MQLDRDCSCGFLSILNRHLESGRKSICNRILGVIDDFEKFIQANSSLIVMSNFSACSWKDKHKKTEFNI